MTAKIKYIIAGALILFFSILGFMSFKKTMYPYVSIREAKNQSQMVQVIGKPIPGRNGYNNTTMNFHFIIQDRNHDSMEVVYEGVKPGTFDEAPDVVVIGQYKINAFYATSLLTKCPSRYEKKVNP